MIVIHFRFTDTINDVVSELKTWQEARDNCIAMGARLMEIRTQEEYDTALSLYHQIGDEFWLGGTDYPEEMQWVWDSNQEEVDLNRFWAHTPGENTNANCLAMSDSGMCHRHCFANSIQTRKSVCV